MNTRQFFQALREGPYTSLGSYPVYFVTADGGVLSHAAALENAAQIGRAIRDKDNAQWRVVGADVNWEDSELYCDDSGERIPSAYAEPDSEAS